MKMNYNWENNAKSKRYHGRFLSRVQQEEQRISLAVEVDTVEDDNSKDVRETVAANGKDNAQLGA